MKILLDECVPAPLRTVLTGHDCHTVKERGWGGVKNGQLLRVAEGNFDLFLTSDQGLGYQQNLAGRRMAILVLSTNKLRPLRAHVDLILQAIASLKPGEFRQLSIPA